MSTVDGLSDNAQKTHYVLQPKRRRLSQKTSNGHSQNKTPFVRLYNNTEPQALVEKRYQLYEHIWGAHRHKIASILNNSNTGLFEELVSFIDEIPAQRRKLPIAFLQLSSNTANNVRVMNEFNRYVDNKYKVINLSSKTCGNIKSTMREIVKQIREDGPNHLLKQENGTSVKEATLKQESTNEGSQQLSEHDDGEIEDDDDDEIEDDEEQDRPAQEREDVDDGDEDRDEDLDDYIKGSNEDPTSQKDSRVNYDLDFLYEWYSQHGNNRKIVIILQDATSVNNQIINQFIKLIYSYSIDLPIKLMIGLSCNNIGSWINGNFNNESRLVMNGFKFESDDKGVGPKILEELFLTHEIIQSHTSSMVLMPSPLLTSIIHTRFHSSNNSIDSLVSEIKLCHMIHFYNSPLSLLVDEIPTSQHIDSLRKLASFKRFIEIRIHKATDSAEGHEISSYFESNESMIDLFHKAKLEFKSYRLAILNLVHFLFKLQLVNGGKKSKFELYKLAISNKLVNSTIITDFVKAILSLNKELLVEVLNVENLHSDLDNAEDKKMGVLMKEMASIRDDLSTEEFQKSLVSRFHNSVREYLSGELVNKSIEELLFVEVFTINGDSLKTRHDVPIFEEKYENLMINLIRPPLRGTLESSLEDCKSYLRKDIGELAENMKRSFDKATPNQTVRSNEKFMNPIINQLFRVYKEAPVSINIYDFYVAFKQSLNRAELTKITMCEELSDSEWDKLAYSWFIQSCFELMMLGLLKEKPKGDYLEKALWKGV